jgi:ubiquinol-cytochrome c reductase cytochrome b subunit
LNVAVLLVVIGGAITLTGLAWSEDYYARTIDENTDKYKNDKEKQQRHKDRFDASYDYLTAVEDDERIYHRIQKLIHFYGIPPEGVNELMAHDPEIQGPHLFREKCASCHSYLDSNGKGIRGPKTGDAAPNLYKFASRQWLSGLFDAKRIVSDDYFGRTKHGTKDDGEYPTDGMVEFVQTNLKDLDDQQKKALQDVIAAVSAEARLPSQSKLDADTAAIQRGQKAVVDTFSCMDCHKFHDDGELGTAPDLTGYGSFEWLVLMISNPEHERLYQDRNDRMPAFGESKELSQEQIEHLAHWLRGDAVELKP